MKSTVVMIVVLALSLCGVPPPVSLVDLPGPALCFAEEQQKVVAKVNGVPITELELEQAIDTYVPPGAYHSAAGQKRDQYRKPALDFLIERELFYQEAKAKGITVSEKDVDKSLSEVKKKYKDKKAFDRALKESGLTLDQYRKIVKRNLFIEKLVKSEVEDKSRYSDKALEEYYNGNKEKFFRPEGFKLRHILLKVSPTATEKVKKEIRDKATDILKRVKAGEDFGEIAYKHSEDDYRVKGGDLGWVHKGRLDAAVEEAAFKLKVGESTLVETASGYHIVKLEGNRPAEQLRFSEVKDALRKELESKKQKELKDALIARLKGKAKVEIY